MRVIARFLVLAVALFAFPAAADPTPEQRSAIVCVIQQQLDAFQKDDGVRAFSYASPHIQAMFRNPETFMEMVSSGYKPVYRPQSVTFVDLMEREGRLIQNVTVVGPDGDAVLALYPMMQMPDGSWRIDGCTLVPLPKI